MTDLSAKTMQSDCLIYLIHAIAWGLFGISRLILRSRDRDSITGPVATAGAAQSAPFSRALVAFHVVGLGVLYFGLGDAVIGGQVPRLFPYQRTAGALLILAGSGLMCWTLVFFRSWRFQAKVEAGHELATGGPFALMRHPIYAGINLLGLGTALWVPTPTELAAALLLVVGSDLRARAEEKLLTQAFGEAYRTYMSQTKRLIPGVY